MFDVKNKSTNSGIAAGCTINVLIALVLFAGFVFAGMSIFGRVLEFAWGYIGLVQWLLLGPLIGKLRRDGEVEMAKGMAIAGGITMLLNGGCWAVMLTVH